MEEAEAVLVELEKNPFIFDYCDCCDHEGEYAAQVHFVKVKNARIVECDWDKEFYTVVYDADVIAEVTYTADGPDITKMAPDTEISDSGLKIYMNYTWTLNAKTKKASNFFNSVDYDYYGENRSCKDEFAYPTPKQLKKVVKVKGYKKWYKRAMRE